MDKIISILIGIISVLKLQFNNEGSTVGVDETKEMIIGANEIGLKCIEKFKDGVQFGDFTEFYNDFSNDESFKSVVEAAYDNYKAIPAEISDIQTGEALELAEIQLPYVNKIMEALKKES